MDKNQKELLKASKWRKLLCSIEREDTIPVSSVGEIKSIRSVASDLNTDPAIKDKYIVNADKDLMLVKITKSLKQ